MSQRDDAIEWVLGEEGGYSNNPDDPGGETQWGISKRAHPDLNILTLAREEAKEIYATDYWDACQCGKLPWKWAMILFDFAVRIGPVRAIKQLQEIVGTRVDGRMGPLTVTACWLKVRKRDFDTFLLKEIFFYYDRSHPSFVQGECQRTLKKRDFINGA
jgi:lysozyme family protein